MPTAAHEHAVPHTPELHDGLPGNSGFGVLAAPEPRCQCHAGRRPLPPCPQLNDPIDLMEDSTLRSVWRPPPPMC